MLLYRLLFRAKNQICSFVFWENLRRANLLTVLFDLQYKQSCFKTPKLLYCPLYQQIQYIPSRFKIPDIHAIFSLFCVFFLTETSYYFTGLCIQPEVKNGMVNIISESGSVLVANVTCNSEYQLVGKKVIKCARGVWSSKAPICTRKFPFNLINLAFSCQICLATPFWLGF